MEDLIATIRGLGTCTAFTRALEMTRLALALREPGAYTVFAPTDAAFARMKDDFVEDLFENRDDLSRVAKYHVVIGRYKAADLLDMTFLKTMEGQRLFIRSSASSGPSSERLEDGSDAHGYIMKDTITTTLLESIKVNGATIVQANVGASNGIAHVIDKVLMPRFVLLI
jgi:uncharacterized surface protein with fasciclin (FAS1) repeats